MEVRKDIGDSAYLGCLLSVNGMNAVNYYKTADGFLFEFLSEGGNFFVPGIVSVGIHEMVAFLNLFLKFSQNTEVESRQELLPTIIKELESGKINGL
ncbi:hypothetical protein BBG03_03355 [Streptococcus dysgalactiae subsp. equisimilis]|uniref:hypothetical protein n=1 Tax=Streptococcus dysgalactiae TaxID=1334 RepID=UPI000807187E|nr:hypothetical protein [Streptococcus dysgalactiae]OBZ00632.1 hypothetical protein BBG03_03355 [Streptococcus dysgalactiae subsp. equisimilis]